MVLGNGVLALSKAVLRPYQAIINLRPLRISLLGSKSGRITPQLEDRKRQQEVSLDTLISFL